MNKILVVLAVLIIGVFLAFTYLPFSSTDSLNNPGNPLTSQIENGEYTGDRVNGTYKLQGSYSDLRTKVFIEVYGSNCNPKQNRSLGSMHVGRSNSPNNTISHNFSININGSSPLYLAPQHKRYANNYDGSFILSISGVKIYDNGTSEKYPVNLYRITDGGAIIEKYYQNDVVCEKVNH
jgi:hypothetical protein